MRGRWHAAEMADRAPPVAFSWGYAGWGNHTRALVEAVDAVEAARGFGPPVFVDVRIRRAVRAVGFRERAFEALLAPARYRWLPGLGNKRVAGESEVMELRDPGEAATLLDVVDDAARTGARVIFFCACASPDRRAECHRGMVADALLEVARRRRMPLTVHEWPGGAPLVADLTLPPPVMRRLQAGAARLPVPADVPVARAAGLPHYSILRCTDGDDTRLAVSGAAVYTPGGWMFPVHELAADDVQAVRPLLDDALVERALLPLGAKPALPRRWRREQL